ncbi:hypothetical protein JHK87_056317 [Glycine soja]|nr:hypothetical protein JHK87_056317 [Glycine soja]
MGSSQSSSGGKSGSGSAQSSSGGGYAISKGSSGSGSGSPAAAGGGAYGAYISRAAFESNPKSYFTVNAYEMEEHLVYNGIDQSYTCWTRYGEKRNDTADYEMHDRVRNTAPTKVDNDKNTDPKAQALKTAMAVKSGGQVFKKKAKQTRTLL